MKNSKMSGGYINQGGSLRANGRSPHKYVIQQPSSQSSSAFGGSGGKRPFVIPRTRAYLLAGLVMASLVAAFLLAWFLSPGYSNAINLCPITADSSAVHASLSEGPKDDLMYLDDKAVPDKNQGTGLEPEAYRPTRYKIFLSPNISSSQTTGTVLLDLDCEIDSAVLELNISGDMLIGAEEMRMEDVSETKPVVVRVKETGYLPDYGNRTRFFIRPEKTIKGHKYRLFLPFNGRLNDQLQGFYKAGYKDVSGRQKYLAATQFSPTDARKAFPCLDRPSLKATFEISIERPDEMRTISNMPLERSEPSESKRGHTIDHFPQTVRMSTYLVAFIVSDLMGSEGVAVPVLGDGEDGGKSFPLRTWSRPEVLDQTEFARNLSSRLLQYYQEYFGVQFPLPKIDMVAVPEFGYNAMENWGLITFRESAMLIAHKSTPEQTKENSALTISHELAHQWFGNLVTPFWWNDLWLKEGFATYVEYVGVDYAEPSWRMLDKFLTSTLQPTLDFDASNASHAISLPVSTEAEIRRMFDAVSYNKGASIIRMMEHFIGQDLFVSSLKSFLKKHAFANARQDELFAELTESAAVSLPAGVTVKEIMDTWTVKAGYPVLDVKREGKQITFTQSKFMLPNQAAPSQDGSRWWVPISLQTRDQSGPVTTKPRTWLPEGKDSVTVTVDELKEDQWVLANINQTGFYRVNYDRSSWQLLIDSYYDLSWPTRSQLLDDSFALAQAGRLDYDVPLILVSRLSHDHQDLPWHAASKQIRTLIRKMSREPAYGDFRAYMLMAVNGVYHTIKFDESPEDDHVTKLHRAAMVQLACDLDHPDCLNRAQYALRMWMREEPRNPIAPDLKHAVYCAGVKQGNVEEWDFLFKMYKSTNVASEKDILLTAMGCSRDPWILARYLEMTLQPDSAFSKQDGARIFGSIAANKHGFDLAAAHLMDNFKKVYQHYGEGFGTVNKMISSLAMYMNKESDLRKIAAFAKELDQLGIESAKKHLHLATQNILNNIYWRKNRYQNLEHWIKEFNTKFHIA